MDGFITLHAHVGRAMLSRQHDNFTFDVATVVSCCTCHLNIIWGIGGRGLLIAIGNGSTPQLTMTVIAVIRWGDQENDGNSNNNEHHNENFSSYLVLSF